MKIELDLHKPFINVFPIYGDIFAITPMNRDMKIWMCNYLTQINYLKSNNIIFFKTYKSIIDECPLIKHEEIKQEAFGENNCDFVDKMKEYLNKGKYIFLYINSFYNPKHPFYKNYNFVHEIFLYGYDDETQSFLCADNLQRKYQKFICSYEEIKDGYNTLDHPNIGGTEYYTNVHLLTPVNKELNLALDKNEILTQFFEYKNSIKRDMFEIFIPTKFESGFAIHDIILKYLINDVASGKDDDVRALQGLYEQKVLMKARFELLAQECNTDLLNKYIELYDYIISEYQVIRNRVIRFSITKNQELMDQIIEQMTNVITVEKNKLDEIYKTLEEVLNK